MSEPPTSPVALRLRALAHPLRWKLIDIVGREDTATATRCSELTGESVASCAYHLGILGKYGYVEQIPGIGKEKPWRLTDYNQDLSAPGPELEDTLASEAAFEAFLEHEFDRIRAWSRRRQAESGEWKDPFIAGGSTMWVTAEEFKQIREEIMPLLQRYTDRLKDPAKRPDGARAARLFVYTAVSPWQ
jgi:hypothetical protein